MSMEGRGGTVRRLLVTTRRVHGRGASTTPVVKVHVRDVIGAVDESSSHDMIASTLDVLRAHG